MEWNCLLLSNAYFRSDITAAQLDTAKLTLFHLHEIIKLISSFVLIGLYTHLSPFITTNYLFSFFCFLFIPLVLLLYQPAQCLTPPSHSILGGPLSSPHPPRPRKPRDCKPKMRKLKYHQYIPPDQRGNTGGTSAF